MLLHWFHKSIDSIPFKEGMVFSHAMSAGQATQELARSEVLPMHVAVVNESGTFLGALNTSHLLRSALEKSWDDSRSLLSFCDNTPFIDVRDTLEKAMEIFGVTHNQILAVCRDGMFVGFLSANDIVQFMWRSSLRDFSLLSSQVNQFVSYVAHDLGNPLTVILLDSGILLQNSKWDEHRGSQLKMIQRAARQAMRISDELVQSERYAKSGTANCERMRLSQFVEEIYSDNAEFVAFKGARFVIDQCDEGEIYLDPFLIRRVLLNLIDNACKYSPKNGEISLSARFTDSGRSTLEFVVRDYGKGIDSDQLERIFEPFVQTGKPIAGYGLGLMIVKRFVELHGGKVWAESAMDIGAKFVVSIPQ